MRPVQFRDEILMDPLQIQKIMDERAYQDWLRTEYSDDLPSNEGPPALSFSNQEKALIRRLVKELPPIEGAVIYLRFWKNCLLEEIAHSFGMKVRRVEEILERALTRLRFLFTNTSLKEAALEPAFA